MSYCRVSCDDWKSDVYCYYHYGGWFEIWSPGEVTKVDTHQECLDKLMKIRAQGFHVPQDAIDRLEDEINENNIQQNSTD